MKLIPAATRALALLIARRANVAKFGAVTGRAAVEADRKTSGVHVPLAQCVTTYESGCVQHPTTGAWFFRVRDATHIAASDRGAAVDAVDAEWEPPLSDNRRAGVRFWMGD